MPPPSLSSLLLASQSFSSRRQRQQQGSTNGSIISSRQHAVASIMLLFTMLLCIPSFHGVFTVTAASSSPTAVAVTAATTSSALEESTKWVLEEEFHGASSTKNQRQKQKRKQQTRQGKVSVSTLPGENDPSNRFGEASSWWDDDDDDDYDYNDSNAMEIKSPQLFDGTKSSGSGSGSGSKTMPTNGGAKQRRRRHRLRLWKNHDTRGKETASPSSPSSSSMVGDSHSLETSTSSTPSSSTNDPPITMSSSSSSSSNDYDEEHPMRTDEWELHIQLSPLYSKKEGEWFPNCKRSSATTTSVGRYRRRQVMQFATNGYVKVLGEDSGGSNTNPSNNHENEECNNNNTYKSMQRTKVKVGKWRVGQSGIAFDIPVQINHVSSIIGSNTPNSSSSSSSSSTTKEDNVQSTKVTVLHYHADIHLNKFGERPRMFRGIITRDRHSSFLPPNFLRPVIGTFSAEGIGHDTSDTSYKERGFGLTRQQALQEANSNR